MTIAFLGLGAMGTGIAANLVKAGHEVTVWNRSADKTKVLAEQGARTATSPAEAASDASVVFSMLADDAALQSVLKMEDGLLEGMPGKTLHISLSTISVATSKMAAEAHAAHGQRFVAAPVFGRPDAAAAGKLFTVAAGAPADLDEAEPLFAAYSQRTFRVGDTPSAANLVKLCGNFSILAAVETMAEAMALAEKGGVSRAALYEVLTNTLFDAPVYKNYGKMIVEDRFTPPGFKAPLGLKDMRLAAESAEATRVPMPLLSLLRDHLTETIAKEGEEIDWAGIARTVTKNAGIGTKSA